MDASDLIIIDFNTISPVQLRSLEPLLLDTPEVRREKEAYQFYVQRELKYWAKIQPTIHQQNFNKICNGIRLIRVSPNHRFIAVGFYCGDAVIYDALMAPWRPFRVFFNKGKQKQSMIDISWSLDSSKIITIDELGYLQVLSLSGLSSDPTLSKNLGLPADDKGIYPHQLKFLLDMDMKAKDFIFQKGTLSEEGAQNDAGLAPQRAAFFPSLSFFGTQYDVIVTLENGDVLKCNIQNALQNENSSRNIAPAPRIYKQSVPQEPEAANVSTIGKNIEAELFRGHRNSIIYMCSIEYLKDMITVDQMGHIFQWKYNRENKSAFGWFTPYKKYQLNTSKIMYKESSVDKPKTVFTDHVVSEMKPRTTKEIAAQRKRVQKELDIMQLTDPWHEEYQEYGDLNMQVFAPRGSIPASGAMFHIVYKHAGTDQLSSYIIRLFKPVKVKCSRIVHVLGSPTGTSLYVILLFDAYPPKGPHFTIFSVDLTSMKLRDFRTDIPLSPQEYILAMQETIISCDVTRVFGPTGSEYMFIIFNGSLRCLSLTTGQPVVKVQAWKDTLFNGCVIDEVSLRVPPYSECTAVCFDGKIHCIVFAKKMQRMFVVSFEDTNIYSDRRAMWKTYTTLKNHKVVATELRVNTEDWLLDDIQHPAVAVRRMLLNSMDKEMKNTGIIKDQPEVFKEILLSDKVLNYKTLEQTVTEGDFLDKEGIFTKR